MMEQHGRELSAKDKKDLRRLDSAFEYESREGASSRHGQRERDREGELPGSSQMFRRREAFGATLTSDSNNLPSAQPSPRPFLLEQFQIPDVTPANSE